MTTEAATTSAPEPGGGRSERAAAALSERLYARHHRMVLGLCRGLLRDPVEAEDAAQQTFLSAHRSMLNGAEPREPAAWLATIARNECWARTSARMREPLPTEEIDDVASTHDPVEEAIRRADLHALWLAIKQLPRQQRDALLLREFGGLRYDELAVALAVSEPSIESLLFRARGRLRMQLKAAYAALTGVGWLEPIARLLAGGGAPAVATKAVALGLGAAAVTGSAVIAPKVLEHHPRPQQARPHAHIVHRVVAQTPVSVEAAATRVPAVPAPTTARSVVRPRERETEHEASTSSSHEGHDGEERTTRSEASGSHDGDGERTTTTTITTNEGEHSQTSSESSLSSGVSGDSSHEGSGSGDGDILTVTEPTTLTIPTTTLSDSSGGDSGPGGSDGSGG